MVLVEEYSETESDLDTRQRIVHDNDKDEETDPELDGFETASEGRGSDDHDHEVLNSEQSDTESEEIDAKEEDSEGKLAKEVELDGHVGIEEVENKLRQVDVRDEPSESNGDVDNPARRQERIDEAVLAKVEGNSSFAQARYVEALQSYDRGLSACPLAESIEDSEVKEIRAVLHANRAACYSNLGNSEAAVKECTKALELNPMYLKALIRRYQAREKLTYFDEAIEDVKKVLELDPGNVQARIALRRLTPLAEEKREKLKKEMIDKLKEAGNSILGRFGMSVDNFKTVQDPATGSYSIQFQR